ncbi:MAG: hypothetical protein ACRDS9_11920 [Pseudonocardiaceae bacterium]
MQTRLTYRRNREALKLDEGSIMKKQTWLTIAVAAAAGAAIWALSLLLTDHREAWDASGGYYPVGLVVAGVLAGMLAPKPLWAHYIGAVLGQLAYMLIFLPTGPLIAVGIIILLVFSTLFLLAAAIGGYLKTRFIRPRQDA